MNLSLNKAELELLLDILSIPSLLVVSDIENQETDNHAEIFYFIQKIYKFAAKNGLGKLFEEEDGFLSINEEGIEFYENKDGNMFSMLHKFQQHETMLEIAQSLVLRDYSKESGNTEINDDETAEQLDKRIREYLDEFKQNGYENLYLKNK